MKEFKFLDWEIEEKDRAALKQMAAVGWKFGAIGDDWRKVIRICNIETENHDYVAIDQITDTDA